MVLLFIISTEAATALRRPCVERARFCCAVVVTAHSLSPYIYSHIHIHTRSYTFVRSHAVSVAPNRTIFRQICTNIRTDRRARENRRTREREMCLCTLNRNRCSVCLREPYSVFSLKRYVLGYTTCVWVPIHSLIHSFICSVYFSCVVYVLSPPFRFRT